MGVRKDCCCEAFKELERRLRNNMGAEVTVATEAGDAKAGTIRSVNDGLLVLENVVAITPAAPYIPFTFDRAVIPICQITDVLFDVNGGVAVLTQAIQNFNANRGS